MAAASPARQAAFLALTDIAAGRSATAALQQRLTRARLTPLDRALATELVYGVLRWQRQLDWIIDLAVAGGRHRPTPAVRRVLRIAAYELLHLRTVPPWATCNEAVELARARQPSGAGFVNAVCRRMHALARSDEARLWPDRDEDPVEHLSVRYSHPTWMTARWLQRFGWDETVALLKANNTPPPLTVRVNRRRIDRRELRDRWAEAGIEAEFTLFSPDGLWVRRSEGGVQSLPGFREGLFFVQDESSQLVAWALSPEPGQRVLDLCSAPGGKTTHVAERMDDRGTIVALDIDPRRLRLLEDNMARLGLRSISPLATDALAFDVRSVGPFDRVLLDAPCTGLGVLRRRADARWQKRPEDLITLADLQSALLQRAADAVRPGGILVYSTCSTEPEETTEQVRAFLDRHPDFALDPLRPVLPDTAAPLVEGDAGTVTLLPHRHGTDGFFIARLVRLPRS